MDLPIAGLIQQSTDYSGFHFDKVNRDVHLQTLARPHRKLYASMKQHGFLKQYPLLVEKNGRGYIIKAGHHRFTVARELQIPFYFLIIEAGASLTLTEAEESTKPWTLADFINGFAKDGRTDYVDARAFAECYKLPEALAFAWLWGESDTSNQQARIKSGEFKIRAAEKAEKVAKCYAQVIEAFPVVKGGAMAKALWAAFAVPGFDGAEFVQKVKIHGIDLIKGRPSARDSALSLIESLWNRQRRTEEKLNVAFLAIAESKKRQQSFGKNE